MLHVDAINTYRGAAHVLRDVALTVGRAEVVCLVGRNGAGKTTTLESVVGLLPVRSGRVTLHDREITRLPPHRRAALGLGYAPEDGGVFPDLTVAENLEIARWLTAGRAARVDPAGVQALFPEIAGFLHRRGLTLSGGQKKMVAIARALALAPEVVLLDEPFEGLAPVVVTRFIEAARTIRALGVSLLIAESHLANALRIADRVYVIDRGEIVFGGDPAGVVRDAGAMRMMRG